MGGNGANSVTVIWANAALKSSSMVMYGTSMSAMTMSATGSASAYTQLLAPMSGNLVTPSMGAPGATAAQIMNLANTSSFAYDHVRHVKYDTYYLLYHCNDLK